jgi:RNA polymerase sigma factor (sigma-70 family)
MDEHNWLADQFEAHRAHLRAVAYRMLGSTSEADDAVQEAWLRTSRADTGAVENFGGWLTTVVARVCLNMLRSRQTRREDSIDAVPPEAVVSTDPEHEVLLADSVGLALLVVLDTLDPAERLAFVLHDMFGVPFDEIAPIVGRSSTAARQLASRARRRVQDSTVPDSDVSRQRAVVDAFLAASRDGDFEALVALLDPDVVLRSDAAAVQMGGTPSVAGARAVAETFSGRAKGAQPALIGGAVGLAWTARGRTQLAFAMSIVSGKIVAIELVADPERVQQLAVTML